MIPNQAPALCTKWRSAFSCHMKNAATWLLIGASEEFIISMRKKIRRPRIRTLLANVPMRSASLGPSTIVCYLRSFMRFTDMCFERRSAPMWSSDLSVTHCTWLLHVIKHLITSCMDDLSIAIVTCLIGLQPYPLCQALCPWRHFWCCFSSSFRHV